MIFLYLKAVHDYPSPGIRVNRHL